MKRKKLTSIALAAALAIGTFGFSIPAKATEPTTTTDYVLTIPATLSVKNAGWNGTSGISATGTLENGKKLTVTASSDGEYALVSGENKVNYKLAASGDTNTTYANATEKTVWEFTSLSDSATTQTMGIVVEDYSTKPAGTYQDTVTFTASVESAAKKLTLTGSYDVYSTDESVTKSLEIEYTDNDTWKDIVERYDEVSTWDYGKAPEGKIIYFWKDDDAQGCQLKSNESTYNYKLVSINDKVSAYSSSSYYLGH